MPEHQLPSLYAAHLEVQMQRAERALEAGGFDHLVIASGCPRLQFMDDLHYPYRVHPHFKAWVPLTHLPSSWLVATPGERPRLVYHQPRDYWHVVPEAPAGYWVEDFDITIVRSPEEARAHLPATAERCAVIGEVDDAVGDMIPNNPPAVVEYLHYHRAFKTPYELTMMRVASKIGVRAHVAARAAFERGESEFAIHLAYCAAAGQGDGDLPYANIIALNEHSAVLHYTELQRAAPARSESFLIDAGASFHGYACDITRTYAGAGADEFRELIGSVDGVQRQLCDGVRAGQDYASLHLDAHRLLAGVLREHAFIRCTIEEAVECGVSAAFFPHGLGHGIGVQVHEVSGFAADESGRTIARPEGHPYLRLTRTLSPGMVVTIEPGIYFIDMLLEQLRAGSVGNVVDWDRVDAFRHYGGVRIEDDVAVTDGDPENMTRDAFAALG